MQAIQYLVICNRGWTDFNERAYINFFFKELNILLQSTKGKPGYSCSLKCELKKNSKYSLNLDYQSNKRKLSNWHSHDVIRIKGPPSLEVSFHS